MLELLAPSVLKATVTAMIVKRTGQTENVKEPCGWNLEWSVCLSKDGFAPHLVQLPQLVYNVVVVPIRVLEHKLVFAARIQ